MKSTPAPDDAPNTDAAVVEQEASNSCAELGTAEPDHDAPPESESKPLTTEPAADCTDLLLSSITAADLTKLRQELQQSLQEEEALLAQQMELLAERKDLACRVEAAETDEQLSKLTAQQEKLNQAKLRMQLEGMYY